MKKLFLISLAVLFVIGLAVSSDAVVKKKGMGMGAGMASCDGDCGCNGSPMEMLKALGLDEKQKEAVQAIHFRTKKEMVRIRADVQVAEIELKEILSRDPVDLKAAEAAVKKIEGVKSEMRMLHIKAMEEIKANLTPEQKKKFISTMGMGMMGHGKGMKGKGHMHCMDDMEEMGPMGTGQQDEGTPPMQHRHN
jgi:Spy/CpxP family protein refolding chaperone